MHFEFVTYRWGEDLFGGAESLHRRLAEELTDAGHLVTVLTTEGHQIRPFCHWGVDWTKVDFPRDGKFSVRRFPTASAPRWAQALRAKSMQRRMELEEQSAPLGALHETEFEAMARGLPVAHLLNGFHHPQREGTAVTRWSTGRAAFVVCGTQWPIRVAVKGYVPKQQTVRLRVDGAVISEASARNGWVEAAGDVPPPPEGQNWRVVELEVAPVWRPLRDFRTLGMLVNSVEVQRHSGEWVAADLMEDYRALLRRHANAWQGWLLDRAKARPAMYNGMMDRLRGPFSRGLERAVANSKADVMVHFNLPWATTSLVRPGDVVMPLWHVDDDYYYWQHWIDAIRRAKFVMAISPYTASDFYPRLGVPTVFLGSPIWPATRRPTAAEALAFRAQHGVADGEIMVLTVCRKSPEKRYQAIADSVSRLRAEGVPVRFIGVGHDVDGKPFASDSGKWVGPLGDHDLEIAYSACDIMAFMSESESFGMVVPEAWHHGKPVVVNRLCQASASLVREDVDGMLCEPGRQLDDALRHLAIQPTERARMGAAGLAFAREHYVRGAAAARLLKALGVG